jgi:hypothetical protein
MAGATIAAIEKALHDEFSTYCSDLLNDEVRAWKMMTEAQEGEWDGSGTNWVESIRIGRNYGFKATAELGQIPRAGNQSYERWTVPMKYVHGAIRLSIQAIKHGRGKGAFVNILQSEIEGMGEDMLWNANRMSWGWGKGILARVDGDIGGGGTVTIPVKDPGGVVSLAGGADLNGARFLRPNMVLAFHAAAPANNTPLAVRTVATVNAAGTQITVDANLDNTTAPDEGVITMGVSQNGVLEGSWDLEPMGLFGLIDDGTYVETLHGLSRTTFPILKCNTIANSGDFDEMVLHRLEDMCDEASGSAPDTLVAHNSVHRQYITWTLEDKRFTGADAKRPDAGIVGGGPKGELQWGGKTIMKERFAPYFHLLGINKDVLRRLPMVDGEWADEDGAILRNEPGTDVWGAFYRMFVNCYTRKVNCHYRLGGINATVDPVNVP